MNKEFIQAIDDLEKERRISKDVLIEAIESALVSAYKKNYGTSQNVRVDIDRESGDIAVLMRMDVVDEVEDELTQISVEEAREIDYRYEAGDIVEYQVTPRDFGRIAAQTAKQVVVQRIREAERGMIFDDYVTRQGEIVTGTVQRISNETMFINLGRTEGILSANEQVPGEKYKVNDRLKVFIMDVKKTTKGPQVFLSRTHPGLVKRLFELEVPEIEDGTVEIKGIAREAGSRTKMAVYTEYEDVDPVGACVGTRGARVQAIVDELHGEKIDIITWSEDPEELIASVLSPAKVEEVITDESGEKTATVIVPDYQLSLAIGKEGQNVRLAAKVSGWKIDIKSRSQYDEAKAAEDGGEGFTEYDGGFVEYDESENSGEGHAEAETAGTSAAADVAASDISELSEASADEDKETVASEAEETSEEAAASESQAASEETPEAETEACVAQAKTEAE